MLGYKIRSKKSSFNNSQNLDQNNEILVFHYFDQGFNNSQNLDQNNEIQEFLKILFKGQFINQDKSRISRERSPLNQ